MKNKIFIAITILITICSCSKENSNMRLEEPKLTPKELVIGKWYGASPDYWAFDISPTYLTFYNLSKFPINNITDSTIWYRKDGLKKWTYTLSKNRDTLYIKEYGKLVRFKN
jgi:hypothetical protein